MRFKNSILVVLFFLCSCGYNRIPEKALNSVINNEKALVFFESKIASYPNQFYIPAHTIWSNTLVENRNYGIRERTQVERFLFFCYLAPGEYTLKEIIFAAINEHKRANDTAILYVHDFINFSVKGGEVIYLGNITFYNYENRVRYIVEDEYDQIYKEIKDVYPILQNRLTKKLIKSF